VADGADGPRLGLRARLDRFAFQDEGPPAYLVGRGLAVEAATRQALRLGARAVDLIATVDLPEAEVPDLTVYNPLLPPGAGLSILSGAGRLALHLELAAATQTGRGELSFTAETARIGIADLEVAGRIALAARLSSPDLPGRRFDLDGSRLTLEPVTYREVGEEAEEEVKTWWARAELPDASVVWGSPLLLQGSAAVEMQDTGLLLAVFSRRRHFLRWFHDALLVEGVTARGTVRLDGQGLAIDSLRVEGGDLEVASRLRLSRASKQGDLFLRHGRLAVGIELRDGKRDFKLLRPREWLESWWGRE
jgi:hypothetical protein